MNKLILDPGLFEIPNELPLELQLEQFLLLKENLDFIDKFTSLALDEYNGAPYSIYFDYPHPTIGPPVVKQNSLIKSKYTEIQKTIYKLISRGDYAELDSNKSLEICPLTFYTDTITEHPFLNYLYWLLLTRAMAPEHIIFLIGPLNYVCYPNLACRHNENEYKLNALINAMTDCSGVINEFISIPNTGTFFPGKALCKDLNVEFLEKRDRHEEDIGSLVIEYGTEAALRNGYMEDPQLSSLNSKKQHSRRIVFRKKDGSKMYLSLDFESGGFEVFNHTPTHLGQFSFAGEKVKPAEPHNHKLYFS